MGLGDLQSNRMFPMYGTTYRMEEQGELESHIKGNATTYRG